MWRCGKGGRLCPSIRVLALPFTPSQVCESGLLVQALYGLPRLVGLILGAVFSDKTSVFFWENVLAQ